MRNSMKLLTSALVLATLAACNKGTDEAATPAISSEPADVVPVADAPASSLVPMQAGITPLDLAQLSSATATKAPCSIDRIGGQLVGEQAIPLAVGANVLFQGWISNPSLQAPEAFAVVLTGAQAYAIRGTAGGERPDVARILKQEGLTKSGFNVNSKFDGVAPGEYAVSFIQDDKGATIQCPTSARIVVSAP